jgi:hypothetical protein
MVRPKSIGESPVNHARRHSKRQVQTQCCSLQCAVLLCGVRRGDGEAHLCAALEKAAQTEGVVHSCGSCCCLLPACYRGRGCFLPLLLPPQQWCLCTICQVCPHGSGAGVQGRSAPRAGGGWVDGRERVNIAGVKPRLGRGPWVRQARQARRAWIARRRRRRRCSSWSAPSLHSLSLRGRDSSAFCQSAVDWAYSYDRGAKPK